MPKTERDKHYGSGSHGLLTWMKGKGKDKHTTGMEGKEVIPSGYTAGMKYIHDNVIGSHAVMTGPFGERRMVYADYTASGKSLYNIENYITKYVLSFYGNTHTSTSFASLQSDKFRNDAKDIIRKCVNASDEDAVIFCGSGCTAAIHKLIACLGLNDRTVAAGSVVFIGPYEHHSNILPWRETGAKLVMIQETKKGQLDMEHLKLELIRHTNSQYEHKMATFSSCSNVTGLLTDTVAVTQLLHMYGVLAFWDYASGAPYLKINMNPHIGDNDNSAYKDAIFCSPHKFVGGPGSPGLLIAKKSLFRNQIPHGLGGGTVLFVTNNSHRYVQDVETREEGGTPGIIESIRAGLAFQLKQNIGTTNIHRREEYLARKGINALHGNPNIILLGSKTSQRVPIFSFVVKYPDGKKLIHHNFIALLLSDLFGIQARGGCACAGPYAQSLLGIADDVAEGIMWFLDSDYRNNSIVVSPSNKEVNLMQPNERKEYEQSMQIANSLEIIKPGFIRINLAYFMTDAEADFALSAINIVANEGWKLLPQYSYDAEKGSWSHRKMSLHYSLMSLKDVLYHSKASFGMAIAGTIHPKGGRNSYMSFAETVASAKKIFQTAAATGRRLFPFDETTMKDYLPGQLLPYVWFLEPHHAMLLLNTASSESLTRLRTAGIPLKPRESSGPTNNFHRPTLHKLAKIHRVLDTPQQRTNGLQKVAEWLNQSDQRLSTLDPPTVTTSPRHTIDTAQDPPTEVELYRTAVPQDGPPASDKEKRASREHYRRGNSKHRHKDRDRRRRSKHTSRHRSRHRR